MARGRIIRCGDGGGERKVRFLTSLQSAPGTDRRTTTVTLTRAGEFSDPRYGRFAITKGMLEQMVRNFNARTLGQDVFIDVAHEPDKGAAAKIVSLAVEGERLRAEVEWTDYGIEAVQKRGFRYLSAEYHENFRDNEREQAHGAVLLGAGLTIRPVVKRLDPVVLSEDFSRAVPVLLHPELVRQLSATVENAQMNWLENLRKQLSSLGLHADTVKQLCDAAKLAAEGLGDDQGKLKALSDSFEETGKKLAEQLRNSANGAPINLTITPPNALTAEQVQDIARRALAEDADRRTKEEKRLAEAKATNVKVYDDAIAAAQGLSEDTRRALAAARDLITAEMTADQVKRLAETQLALANKIESARQLSTMGFRLAQPVGHVHIDTPAGVKKLAQEIHANLRRSSDVNLIAPEPGKEHKFVQRVLALYDTVYAPQLELEHKRLAGEVSVADTNLPVSFTREVIREALSDLNILALIQLSTDPTQTIAHQIPYETRDTAAASANDGVVYEGQPIPYGGVTQGMETAYIVPIKVAMRVTNEVMHFTRSSGMNWDAWARAVESNARLTRDLLQRRIANTLQRVSDAYLSVAVAAENHDAQTDAARTTFKTTNFPVVRPFQERDVKGTAIGAVANPITVTLAGAPLLGMYDGTGTQAAGNYWRFTNWNLGYYQIVNQAGAVQTPGAADTLRIDYHYATNIVKVDSDVPGGSTKEKQMNKVLQAIGARKAVLSADRFVMPDFLLTSPVLHNDVTDAELFGANNVKPGTNLDNSGSVGVVKAVPLWETNAPDIDFGDERILIGQRGRLAYTVAKPFAVGAPFEAIDVATGKPTGEKIAYGEEYSSLKVPAEYAKRHTSVIVYSVTARAAA